MAKKEEEDEFKKIKNKEELVEYLEKKSKSHKAYHHYTTINSIYSMFNSGYMFLSRGNSVNMNDQQECRYKGTQEEWNKTYISSFSYGDNENIAMWGLYSIPWENGGRFTIDRETMKSWLKKEDQVYKVEDNKPAEKITDNRYRIFLTDVVYVKCDDKNDVKIYHAGVLNDNFNKKNKKNFYKTAQMTGYVKNKAWEYENEVRIIVKFENPINYDKIAIKLPKKNKISIMKGPYCRENTNGLLSISPNHITESIFRGLVNLRTPCAMCKHEYSIK